MEEDWNDGIVTAKINDNDDDDDDEPLSFNNIRVGRSFGKGRGFIPHCINNNKDFDTCRGDNDDNSFNNKEKIGFGGRSDFAGRKDKNSNFNNRRNRNNNNDSDGVNFEWKDRKGFGGIGDRKDRRNDYHTRKNKIDNDYDDVDGTDWSKKNNKNYDNFEEDGGGNRRGRSRKDDNNYFHHDDRNIAQKESNTDGGDVEEKEKLRPPIYIPTEKTEDELLEDIGITKGINFDDYKNIQVNVSGNDIPSPISSFRDVQLRSLLMENLERCCYDEPTPIQKYSIPIIMSGRDLMATAQTGSGKTAAFLLPIIQSFLSNTGDLNSKSSKCQPNALILTPTRELTIQIYEVAKKFALRSHLKVCRIYGGAAISYQSQQLLNGCNILIATPGRLNDFVNRGILDFGEIKFVVLDEADRMLDMGFRSSIENFLNHPTMVSPNERQTLMFSATFSQEIQKLAGTYLNDYLFLAVGIVGGACKDVLQNFIQVSNNEKKKTLMALLDEQSSVQGTLIFVEEKRTTDFVASYLSSTKYPTTSMHGDRFQQQREEALRDFKNKRMHILVATSVAARGLDIHGVRHVINYDLPKDIDEYVHRIGRTGRLGNEGKATSFYDSSRDRNLAANLVKILEQAKQNVPRWLKDDASESGDYVSQSFGGYDYREKNKNSSFKTNVQNQPEQIPDDEAW